MLKTLPAHIKSLLLSSRGVATSLLEATATITVGVTLASAAIVVVSGTVQQAKIARAQAEVQEISNAMGSFNNDMLHYPIFFSGAQTGPTSPSADVIRSKVGAKAEIGGPAETAFTFKKKDGSDGSRNWNDEDEGTADSQKVVTTFEAQLNANGPRYTRRGEFSDNPTRGFNGPYFEGISPTDPWGNKYYVNARFLNPAKTATESAGGEDIKISVFVLSAGPNETIQTPYGVNVTGDATPGNIKVQGDDIASRVR